MTGPQVVRFGLGERRVPYHEGWDEQRRLHAARAVAAPGPGAGGDVVLLLEHEPVYTAGRRTAPHERPLPGLTGGAEVVDVDRGGKITWHGPGQLVGYPILRLPDPVDVVAHVRRLEEVLVRSCGDLGVTAGRVAGRSGVWVLADERGPDRKVAAIGVRVAQGVTMHGFALNADPDLAWFGRIVPCGILDAGVTSLTAELGRRVGVLEAAAAVERHLPLLAAQPAPA